MFNNSKRILSILMSVIMIVTSAVSAAVSSGAVEEITAAFESTSKETTGNYYPDETTVSTVPDTGVTYPTTNTSTTEQPATSAPITTEPTTIAPTINTDRTTEPDTSLPPDGFSWLVVEIDRHSNEAKITGCYSGLKGDVVIPDFYRGYPVTTIADDAFRNGRNIKSLTLGRLITKIGEYAFDGCYNIEYFAVDERNPVYSTDKYGVLFNKDKTVLINYPCGNSRTFYAIPDSVLYIVSNMFGNSFSSCYNLTNLIIGDGLTTINDLPNNIMNLTIGAGITSINCDFSFYDNINSFTVDEKNTAYSSDIHGVLFNKDKTTLIIYPRNNDKTEYTIPDSVETVGTGAFRNCKNLADITIPESVTIIADSAFAGCTKLTDITIPDSVTSMGNSVFYGCSNLKNIKIGNNVESIMASTFAICHKLENVTFGNNITSIGSCAFEYCISLKSITLGNNVKTIENHAFQKCESLENVTLSNNITSIGYSAFLDCPNLKSVTIGPNIMTIDYAAFGYNSNNTITEGFTIYGYTGSAAEEYAEMYGITFISLGTYNPPIQDDELLKYLTIEDYGNGIWITHCDESIKGDIIIPDMIYGSPVTGILEGAFENCTGITSVKIGKNLNHIQVKAFYGCSKLESFAVDKFNTAFANDEYGVLFNKDKTLLISYPIGSGITSYNIPDRVTEFVPQAFDGAKNLEYVTIPDSVTILCIYAFANCTSIASITIPDSVTQIGGCSFISCTSLTSVTIPDSVTQIGSSSFSKCTNLKNVTIGNGVTTIGYNAFGDCISLENLTLGNSVTEIHSDAFNGCKNLLSVTINPQVTTIGENAFGTYYNSVTGETELVEGFTIYGYTGTEAEAYAKRYGINFVSLGVIEKEELEIDDSSITVDIDNLIATIIPGKTADEIAAMIKNEKFRIIDKHGNEIHGNSAVGTGSTIQIENADGHITEYTVIVPADIDGNGKTTAADARLALRASARIDILEDVYALAADVSNDGRVTAMDARTILRIAAGLEKPNIGTESGTEAVAPDFGRLSELITLTFGNSFNRDKADTAYVIDNLILANILCPAYNAYFSRDSYQALGEGNTIKDPLDKFSCHYYKIPVQNVKWICENIYNIEFDINYTSTGENPWGNSYYYDGYIYAFYPQSGSGPWEYKTHINSHTLLDNGKYEIIARFLKSDNFGESFDYETSLIIQAEWKQIDGRYDWVFESVNELRAIY